MITLPPLGQLDTRLWHALLDMSGAEDGWTLIGGQMVFLLGLEHGATPPRISADIDVVVDIRAQPARMPFIVSWLNEHRYELGEPDPDGCAHRFTRDAVTLDLMTADGAGARARRATSSSTVTPPVSGAPSVATSGRLCRRAYGPDPLPGRDRSTHREVAGRTRGSPAGP